MPHIERTAAIAWDGNLARGAGGLTAAGGAFADLGFSLATRVAASASEGKTSPEELLAAAHGACFTMSLAGELTQAGTPPGHIDVSCRIEMDEVEGQGHQITASNIEAIVAADGVDAAALAEASAKADEGCPFSQLLRRAGADVRISARLG